MKSILDPNFKYVPSHDTNIRATFARIRKEQKARQLPVVTNVRPIQRAKA